MENLISLWHTILTSNLFNFVLMIVLLGWLIEKFDISGAIEKGRKSIEDKILNSKQEHKSALENLYKTQEKGVEVDKEILDIIDKSAQNAVLVGEQLIKDAKRQSEIYAKTTQKAIETNIEKLRLDLTNDTAQKAIERARNHIEKLLKEDRSLHIKYINESIEQMKGIEL